MSTSGRFGDGSLIKPRPRAVWVVTSGLLLVASLGVFSLNAKGLTQADSFRLRTAGN